MTFRLKCAAALAGLMCSMAANAITSFDLPTTYTGNKLGLAYRASDGHFFVTHAADSRWGLPLLYEFDSAGALQQTIDLSATLAPYTFAVDEVSATSHEVIVRTHHVLEEAPENYIATTTVFSNDLSAVTGTLPDGGRVTRYTDTQLYSFDYMTDQLEIRSRTSDAVQSISLSGHFGPEVGCGENSCGVAIDVSWDGGFFMLDHSLRGRLLQFDAGGNLINAMEMGNPELGNSWMTLATDVAGRRLFLLAGDRVVTLTESEFLVNTVPEPGTWLTMGLGLAAIGAAVRARRPSQRKAMA
jgi:hypothetical protein